MSLLKLAFVCFLFLPAAEITAFTLIALAVGWFWTIGLFVATTFLGICLLKRSGRRDFDRLWRALRQEGAGALAHEPGMSRLVAGILLIFPGFISDFAGALMLLPPIRRRIGAVFLRPIIARRRNPPHGIVNLAPEEWRLISEMPRDDARKQPSE